MLLQFTLDQITELLGALDGEDNQAAELHNVLRCLEITGQSVRRVEEKLKSYKFTSLEEEIHFFKNLKPQLDGRLIYYSRLLRTLQMAPIGGIGERSAFFRQQIANIDQYYKFNAELHLYYRLGYHHLDQYYFVRVKEELLPETEAVGATIDKKLHARKSQQYACFFGFQLLIVHLAELSQDNNLSYLNLKETQPLTWTASQAAIVELIYALNELKVFDGQTHDIKKVADYFSKVFNIKISNSYGTHEDNRLRKKVRTPFMDALKKAIIAKYDYDDEHSL